MKNINTLETIATEIDADTLKKGMYSLKGTFGGMEATVLKLIGNMCGENTGMDKFLQGVFHCYGLMINELNHDFNYTVDLETYRKACELLDDWAEQLYEEPLEAVIDNICSNFVDAIESIDKYRMYKGQQLAKAHHYREAEDSILGIEDDVETLLTHFIGKTSSLRVRV